MNHDRSLTPSFSPSFFSGNFPEGGHCLPAGHVHVWRAIVDVPLARLQVYQNVLSPDEQERAQRFKISQHQRRFTAARGILRHVLARYLRTSPRDIRFQSGHFGKPFLQKPVDRPLHFNVAHSQHLAVYAVSRDFEVGIDLEGGRFPVDYVRLAERICSPEEFTAFQKLPQTQQKAAFFRCWTRKEAFVKAIGKGFSFPLKNLTVSFTPDEPPRILETRPGPVPVSVRNRGQASRTGFPPDDWSLFNLPLSRGFWGALAVPGRPSLVRCWDYHPED